MGDIFGKVPLPILLGSGFAVVVISGAVIWNASRTPPAPPPAVSYAPISVPPDVATVLQNKGQGWLKVRVEAGPFQDVEGYTYRSVVVRRMP